MIAFLRRPLLPAIKNLLQRFPSDLKSTVRWLGVAVTAATFVFSLLTSWGFWNEWRGDNSLLEVAARFDKSFTTDASSPVRPSDPAWLPLMRVIRKYSHADLPTDREPLVFARSKAILSAKDNDSGTEWTAPTTPIVLIYKEWPGHGDVPRGDWRTVGTIEDLHNWIRNDEADFDFRVRTYIFNVLTLCVGVFLALPEKPKRPRNSDSDEPPARA